MKFSVIIPSYNYGHFIKECLNSVLAQTYSDWECLIIDNASTDNTESICREYLQDTRFNYIKLNENQGPSHARNIALKQCKGDFVLFLDADDLIENNKLQSAHEIINETNSDLVFTDFRYFSKDPEVIHKTVSFKGIFEPGIINAVTIREKLVEGNVFAISCVIAKRSVLEKAAYFDEKISYNEDWDLWLRISIFKVAYYYDTGKNVQTLIRDHGSSFSKDRISMYLCGLYVCKKNLVDLSGRQADVLKAKMASHRYSLKTILQEKKQKGESMEPLMKRLDHDPLANGELITARKVLISYPFLYSFYLFLSKIKHVIADR
jgi:glycosyltransferase involved in cell wall biosynthesis